MGCYSCDHKELKTVTVINYVGGFLPGGYDVMKEKIDNFVKEDVTFRDMPYNFRSWK